MGGRALTPSCPVIVAALLAVATVSTSGQTTSPPQTRDGHPDLQGIWVNNSATPLERPQALQGKAFFTDDEVAQLNARAARYRSDATNDFAPGDNLFLAVLNNTGPYKNPNATSGADDSVVRVFDNRTSLIVNPSDGRIPPFTPEGLRRRESQLAALRASAPEGPESLPNFVRCTTYGVPRLGGNAADYSGYYEIVQAPRHVVLFGEANHEARIIPLDDSRHLPANIRLWNGDSRGHWQGRTLVVDTTNFSPKSLYMGAAENLHLIERFTRTSADNIDYEITLDDPTTWTQAWTAVIRLKKSQDRIYEFACHEGSFEIIRNVLAGARAEEKAAEEATKKRPK